MRQKLARRRSPSSSTPAAIRAGSLTTLRALHMNHINAVVDGYDQTVRFWEDVYGAQLVADMPRDEWHACLIVIGGVIFELFAPHDDLLHARFGPHYVGVEYQIPDLAEARAEVDARGIRIIRDIVAAFHVHPADAFGVALEFYDRSFHTDPPPAAFHEPMRPVSWWRDEHPLGCCGLKRFSVGVADLDGAQEFLGDLLGAEVVYEEVRSRIGARVSGLQVADTMVELLTSTSDGVLSQHLARWGDGIRSVVLQVRDLRQARDYLASHGIDLESGDAEGALAAPAAANLGLLFEFSE